MLSFSYILGGLPRHSRWPSSVWHFGTLRRRVFIGLSGRFSDSLPARTVLSNYDASASCCSTPSTPVLFDTPDLLPRMDRCIPSHPWQCWLTRDMLCISSQTERPDRPTDTHKLESCLPGEPGKADSATMQPVGLASGCALHTPQVHGARITA